MSWGLRLGSELRNKISDLVLRQQVAVGVVRIVLPTAWDMRYCQQYFRRWSLYKPVLSHI